LLKILVVGGGAREHTLVWKLAQSPKVKEIYVAPGNAGTAQIAHNLDISPTDIESLAKVAQEKGIEGTISVPGGKDMSNVTYMHNHKTKISEKENFLENCASNKYDVYLVIIERMC